MMPTKTTQRRTYKRRTPQNWKTNWPSNNPQGRSTKPTSRGGRNWQYGPVRTTLENKINAYRYLYAQCQTTGQYKPSPAVINRFANLVNKGATIHKVSGVAIARWYKNMKPTYTASWATKGLKWKYGAAIKAVWPTGNGRTYMVATSPNYKGKPFRFPNR